MSGSIGFQPLFHITHRMTAGLTRIERARGFLEAARLSEDWLETMRSRAFVLEAHHTTHIEGTRLTLEQAERLLAGEEVGHEARFQPGQLSLSLYFKTDTRIQRHNLLNYSDLLIFVRPSDEQCLQFTNIEMLLSETSLKPQNLITTKR